MQKSLFSRALLFSFIILISLPEDSLGQSQNPKECEFLLDDQNVSPLKTLYDVVKRKAGLSQSLARVEQDLAQTTAFQELSTRSISKTEKDLRDKFVSMIKTPGVDRSVYDLANAEVVRRSTLLTEALLTQQKAGSSIDNSLQAFDYLVVGAGVHGQIFARNTLLNAPNAKIVMVDQQQKLGSTFSLGDYFFRLNSPVRATEQGSRPRPGQGNLNELTKAVFQLSDFVSEKFPVANQLSDTLVLNQSISPAEVLLQQTVKNVVDSRSLETTPDWPARYEVEMESGIKLYANKVIVSTGIGKDRVPETVKTAVREFQKNDDFRVQTFTQALRRAASTQTPFREYVGQRVMIVGNGDGARVKIEWLLRLAPSESYGLDTVQVGAVDQILWVGQSAKDCADYINNVRVRYAGIASGFKSEKIEPFDSPLQNFKENTDGSFDITLASGEVIQADRIIFSTGYEDKSYRMLKNIVQRDQDGQKLSARSLLQNSSAVVEIIENVRGVGKNVIVGKRVLGGRGDGLNADSSNKQDIYFTGTAARIEPTANELAGVTDNKVAIFINGPRTATLAKKLARKDKKKLGQFPPFDPTSALQAQISLYESTSLNALESNRFNSPLFVGLSSQLSTEALLLSELNRFLGLQGISKSAQIELSLSRNQSDDITILAEIVSKNGTRKEISSGLVTVFQTNPTLVNLLFAQIGGENATSNLNFSGSLKDGKLDLSDYSLNYN